MVTRRVGNGIGWVMASALLALLGVVSLAGAPRQDARASKERPAAVSPASGSDQTFAPARAETDTLDLQLD
jgi:hypothetical protein